MNKILLWQEKLEPESLGSCRAFETIFPFTVRNYQMALTTTFSFSSKNFGPQKGWDLMPHYEISSALWFFFTPIFTLSLNSLVIWRKRLGWHIYREYFVIAAVHCSWHQKSTHEHVKVGDCSLCLKISTLNCSRGWGSGSPARVLIAFAKDLVFILNTDGFLPQSE